MEVKKITLAEYDTEVLNSTTPVLIDFYADWCGPCKMMSPIVDMIAEENDDIKVFKVNVDEESELAEKFSVMSIPTLALVKDGKLVDKSVGAKQKSEVLKFIGK